MPTQPLRDRGARATLGAPFQRIGSVFIWHGPMHFLGLEFDLMRDIDAGAAIRR
jgi:hypothetical protein